MSAAGLTHEADLEILSPEAVADPHGYFAPLREQHSVLWDPRHRSWLVLRHGEVSEALKDPTFSSDRIAPFIDRKLTGPDTDPKIRAAFEILRDWLVFNDPPRHTRLRKLIFKAFTPRAIARMGEDTDALCTELLSALPRTGAVDLKRDFADPLSATVIAQMLGVPPEDRDRFKAWSADASAVVSGGLDDPDRYTRAAAGMTELAAFCQGLIDQYRRSPVDNLMTRLVEAQEEDETLTDAEVIATCTLVLFAGHETTANLIANAVRALLLHPEQLAALRDGRVPVRPAVEELLRFDGPGKAMMRVLTANRELGGRQMRAGQRVFLILASANHDPRVFDAPNELRLDRDHNPHIAFGHGVHHCMGSSLARMEASVAIPRVLAEFPDMWLTDAELAYQPVLLARGLESLPVRVGG